jgi:16S rRNA (uracil1498-N3)-methyltransferase
LTTHRFYIEEKPRKSIPLFLGGKEHHHLSKVARIKPGERVWLFDDSGNQYKACVEKIEKNRTRLLILERDHHRATKVRVTLAQVLLKSKSMNWVIQKATELGAYAIVPIISERTVVKIESIQDNKWERWKRIAIESSKQCGRSALPDISPPISLNTFIEGGGKAKKLFLSERGGTSLRKILMCYLNENKEIPQSVILLVGPEGGWTEDEEQDIMGSHYEAVSLGSLTLRSETAAIAGLAMVSHFWENANVS